MFLPTTKDELTALGWHDIDVILVTGDTYVDSPSMGVALIGKILVDAGFRVGIIAQPDVSTGADITRLGEPRLFWGVTGGSVDSMVANYTATGRRRKDDDFTPGGANTRRPDRAVVAYSNLIRKYFKKTRPIVLGGIEASLRRIAHYDFSTDRVRRSILFDAKADYLLYGMADRSVVELACALRAGDDPRRIRGLCYAGAAPAGVDYLLLPSFREVASDKGAFLRMFGMFYRNNDPLTAAGLLQRQDTRYLVHNPPQLPLSEEELDRVHALPFEREVHPYYRKAGPVRALDTIRFSITTHRGCYGECNFCAIAVHQGRTVTSRSISSVVEEAASFAGHPGFKGVVSDVGGATANMYGIECRKKISRGVCPDKRCLFPSICESMPVNHGAQVRLLRELRRLPHVRKVFVASGIRYDMVLADRKKGDAYLAEVVEHHVSGQLKVAPEHSEQAVLGFMGKPGIASLLAFKDRFDKLSAQCGKPQFLTYYFIAAHPGCGEAEMRELGTFVRKHLSLQPEQAQIFTPTPSTWSTAMYHTGIDPATGEPIFVERDLRGKDRQKAMITGRPGRPGTSRTAGAGKGACLLRPPRKRS